jgi:hypothetical protein
MADHFPAFHELCFISKLKGKVEIHRKEVEIVAQDVLCEVDNCVYHKNDNRCGASQIFVVSHKGNHKAESSAETDCKTFKRE